jgi:cytochrome c556
LFPEGSEGGEAAPAIWEDRAGFDEALAQWRDAIAAAQEAAPASLDDAGPVLGPVFNACKNCHDTYRIEEE